MLSNYINCIEFFNKCDLFVSVVIFFGSKHSNLIFVLVKPCLTHSIV